MTNSRRKAAFALGRWLATCDFPDTLLPDDDPDRGFVQNLAYTAIRRFRPLRSMLGELLERWPKGELEALLLIGAAQVMYMDEVPDFAAVSETVDAAKISGRGKRLDRVVNGVLRNLIRHRDEFMSRLAAAPIAVRESYPDALVERWVARYGADDAEALAKWHNLPAETWLAYPPGSDEGDFVMLPHGRKVKDVAGYADGAFIVQDPATAGAVELLDVKPGQTVLDLCAAPGGKTIQIAWRLRGEGRLVAQEVNESRLRRLKENLARLRMEWVETTSALPPPDAQAPEFDRVLADVPCSNTGVLRRRPDARWRWNVNHLNQLTALQGEILEAAAKRVAPGGLLVYSTCSNEPEENEGQISRFLDAHHEFSEVARRESLPFRTGHDGAFSCAMRRA